MEGSKPKGSFYTQSWSSFKSKDSPIFIVVTHILLASLFLSTFILAFFHTGNADICALNLSQGTSNSKCEVRNSFLSNKIWIFYIEENKDHNSWDLVEDYSRLQFEGKALEDPKYKNSPLKYPYGQFFKEFPDLGKLTISIEGDTFDAKKLPEWSVEVPDVTVSLLQEDKKKIFYSKDYYDGKVQLPSPRTQDTWYWLKPSLSHKLVRLVAEFDFKKQLKLEVGNFIGFNVGGQANKGTIVISSSKYRISRLPVVLVSGFGFLAILVHLGIQFFIGVSGARVRKQYGIK